MKSQHIYVPETCEKNGDMDHDTRCEHTIVLQVDRTHERFTSPADYLLGGNRRCFRDGLERCAAT